MNVFYPTDVSRLSVNLRFSSLLLFLLQIEACWRRSVKGAVHRVLHKHHAKQEKSRSGQVTWTHHWSGSSLDPIDSSRVQSPGHTETDLFIYFCPFLSAFPEALTQESSCRSACQTPGGDVSSQSAGAAAALLRSWNTRVNIIKHDMFLTVLLKWYLCVTSGSDGPQTGSQKHVGLSLN